MELITMKAAYKDRGNIKWTAMMLPEHKTMLVDLEQLQYDVSPPEHDSDQLAEMAESLARAMMSGEEVKMKFWMGRRHHEFVGIVKRIDPMEKAVLIESEEEKQWIPASHIITVE